MTDYNVFNAFREAVADTGIAFVINVPLNFLLVWVCIDVWNIGTFWTSVALTTFFTVFALIRKTYLRMHFHKRHLKKSVIEK